MRIINNPLNLTTNEKAKSEGIEAKVSAKLVELLMSSDNGKVSLEGVLLGKLEGSVKLNLPKVGLVEVPLRQETTLPEGSQVSAHLTLSEGKITAQLQPLIDESADLPKVKASEQLLLKLNLPLTKMNQEAADLLIQYKIEPSADKIKQLAEGSFLASKINAQIDLPEMEKVLKELFNQNEVDQSLLKEDSLPKISLKKIVVALVQGEQAPLQVEQPIENEPVEGQEIQFKELVDKKPVQKETVQEAKEILGGLDAKKLLALMSLGESFDLEQLQRLKKTFSTDEGQIHLKHKLLDQLKEQLGARIPTESFKNALEAWVTESGNKMDVRALNSLEALISENEPQLMFSVKETVESIRNMSSMVEQLPQHVYGLQIPLMIENRETQLELYINRRKSKKSNEGFKMLLALQTEAFDQVQVLVSDEEHKMTVAFRVSDEASKAVFEQNLESLKDELSELVPHPVEMSVGLKFEEPMVLSVLGFMGMDSTSQIDARI